eukprot:2881339-Prymnesium_polylepis.1
MAEGEQHVGELLRAQQRREEDAVAEEELPQQQHQLLASSTRGGEGSVGAGEGRGSGRCMTAQTANPWLEDGESFHPVAAREAKRAFAHLLAIDGGHGRGQVGVLRRVRIAQQPRKAADEKLERLIALKAGEEAG